MDSQEGCRRLPGRCSSVRTKLSESLRDRVLPKSKAGPVLVSSPIDRVNSIDWLRILAASGVVWFHTELAPHRQIGYAGLPIFLLIFFSLITRQDSADPTSCFLRRRYKRILRPWLFWSAVYGACRLTKAMYIMDLKELWGMLSLETLLAGTSIHLWYLPYAFVSGFFVYEVNRRTAKLNHTAVVLAATIIGALTLAVCEIHMANLKLMNPFGQWRFGLATIPLGFAVGRALAVPTRGLQKTLLAAITLIILIECLILRSLGFETMVIPYGIATAFVCIAYCWEIRNSIFTAALAPLTFGVYLIHPLVAYALYHLLVPSNGYCLFILLTICMSALITRILMETPVRRFL